MSDSSIKHKTQSERVN